jgi:hypothetical protein
MKKPPPTRGGARQGAGRKPQDAAQGARKKLSITLSISTYQELARRAALDRCSLSTVAEQSISSYFSS